VRELDLAGYRQQLGVVPQEPYLAIGNSTIQLSAEPSMRGRAIALWQVAFQGTTPIGGPAIGWIIAATGPRTGLAVGGASCFVAALGGIALARLLPDN
jgi:MFS family permease